MRNAYNGSLELRWIEFRSKSGKMGGVIHKIPEQKDKNFLCFKEPQSCKCYNLDEDLVSECNVDADQAIDFQNNLQNATYCGVDRKPQSDSFKVLSKISDCSQSDEKFVVDWRYADDDPDPIHFYNLNEEKIIYIVNKVYLYMLVINNDYNPNAKRLLLRDVFHCNPSSDDDDGLTNCKFCKKT